MVTSAHPELRVVVLDTTDARELAEFYRQLLGYSYREGYEPPPAGQPDPKGEDWLVLEDAEGRVRLAFQQVPDLAASTWPEPGVPQQFHLDLTVADAESLAEHHRQATELGAGPRGPIGRPG